MPDKPIITEVVFYKIHNQNGYLAITTTAGEEKLVGRITKISGSEESGAWRAEISGRTEHPILTSAVASKAFVSGYFAGIAESQQNPVKPLSIPTSEAAE